MSETGIQKKLGADPWKAFEIWFDEAYQTTLKNPNAMIVSTVGEDSRPSTRTVLLKHWSKKDGFVFFTNYNSRKGSDLENNPNCSALFFWDDLERQIRIEGVVKKTSRKVNEEYFSSRPRNSQIGAWASHQSTQLNNREELVSAIGQYEEKFKDADIPLPDFWGGYSITPSSFEFWQGVPDRLHERLIFKLNEAGSVENSYLLNP